MAAERVFVDTNVLVYASVASAPHHGIAREHLERLSGGGSDLWISRQVVREYLATLTRDQLFSKPQSLDAILPDVAAFEGGFGIADENADTMLRLLEIIRQTPVGGKQIHDANIVATMLVNDIRRLLTFNRGDFERFSNLIEIEGP
ncbi:MAG: PIN domain-containing protein [Deltaproteobacteria bacterium]|nr:PIN domain-containing protein [Deltaproteobacteria bacterium]